MNIDKVVSFVRDVQHAKEQTRKWHEALENMTKAYVKANGTNDEIGITIGELCFFEVRNLGSSGNGLKMLGEMLAHFRAIQLNNNVWELNEAIDRDYALKKESLVTVVMEEVGE